MRIAIDTLFEHPDRPTGAIDYLRNVARVFPRVGPQHDYYLLTSDRNIWHFRDFQHSNLHFIRCFRSNENMPLRILTQQGLIPVLMKSHKIDVLYAPGNVCPFWGTFCRVLKINTLHHYQAPHFVGRARALYRRFFFAESARRATHILANTALTKKEICKFMRIPEEKVTVVAEPLYDVYCPVAPDQARNTLNRHGLERDYILFVSTLYPYKNTETLIKSFAHLTKQGGLDFELVIVGRDFDSQLPKLQSVANHLGVSERVRFLGFVPTEDLPAIYSSAKVFVFPSLVETFGKPLVEAMRCGVPVVASNTSCIPEVLGGAGLLVNPSDPVEMASAITQAIEDRPLRKDLIERGLQRAQNFSWENGARQTLAVMERALKNWKISHRQPEWVHGA